MGYPRRSVRLARSILQRLAHREAAALDECIRRYGRLVWRIARRYGPRPEDVEDTVQDVFLHLWCHADRFDPVTVSEPGFIATIARRRSIDRCRRTEREPALQPLPDPSTLADDAASDHVEIAQEAARVAAVLAELRPQERLVIELSLLHDRSHREISAELDMPLGTVKSLVRRGKNRARETLERDPPMAQGATPE